MKILGRSFFEKRGGQAAPEAVARPAMDPAALLQIVKAWENLKPERNEAIRMIEDFNRMGRAYAAAEMTEYNADFKGTYGAANSEILPSKYSVRSRVRTLVKDTPQGRAIERTFQNNVIGPDPFKLDMRCGDMQDVRDETTGKPITKFVPDEDTNAAIEKFWKWFCRPENFHTRKKFSFMEFARVVEAELIGPGSMVCRLHRDYEFNEIKFAVEDLEEDRLQETYMGYSPKDGRFGANNPIRGSIEYHPRWKFPLAYWILTRHPNDFYGPFDSYIDRTAGVKNFREQVPAADVIHINNLMNRAEQEIGQTEMDAAVQPIWRNNQFDKALTLCAIASHIRAFVLEKDAPTGMDLPQELREQFYNTQSNLAASLGADAQPNPAANQQASGSPVQTMRPGQERTLPVGVKAKVLAPEFPTSESHDFRLDNHRLVAVATGASYQHASGDFQNLGFIAGLMCQIPFQDWCRIRQQHLKETWLFRLLRESLRAAIASGWFDRRGFDFIQLSKLDDYIDAADFKAKRWAFVNPLVQMQTLILALEAGIMPPQQVQDELPNGVCVEDLYSMYATAKTEASKHGLDFSAADPTRPSVAKGVPGQAVENPMDTSNASAPAKSKTSNPVSKSQSRSRFSNDTLEIMKMSMNGEH
jgi:capsid protein